MVLMLWVASLSASVVAQDRSEEKLGQVSFPTSCAPEVRESFDRAVALLHSFWYEAAEAAFLEIAQRDPECAMAYWGVAMTAVHPLWPDTPDYDKGRQAAAKAAALGGGNALEAGYIDAVMQFFVGTEPPDYPARKRAFERAMGTLHERFPDDAEVTIFYALALTATAPPEDETYVNQKQAAALLDGLAPLLPEHPGILHYTIHAYDSPEMAEHALQVARRYTEVASSVPHGLHMSSHIFTRLGLWQESVATNGSASHAGHGFASELGLPGAWDEELHAMEYWMYALLQLADDDEAKNVLVELQTHPTGSPMTMKSAHPFAGIPARYVLERRQWKAAATLDAVPGDLPWDQFPFAYAMTVYARAIGAARTQELADARSHLEQIESLRDRTNDPYWARQIEVLRLEASAWLAHAEGNSADALRWLESAVELEESMEKHAVTPGPIVPAREQLGELLVAMGRPAEGLTEYEAALAVAPNRFNGLYGAGVAARDMGDMAKAREYFTALVAMCDEAGGSRPELDTARSFIE
jgi:tetratricopeptide (TPR) repeat protein